MSWTKTHDLAVKTGSYTDRDGKEKGRYENVGHVLRDGEQKMLLLKRTFNPAGVANPDSRDTVILSVFPVKERDGTGTGRPASSPPPRDNGGGDFNDDIPF